MKQHDEQNAKSHVARLLRALEETQAPESRFLPDPKDDRAPDTLLADVLIRLGLPQRSSGDQQVQTTSRPGWQARAAMVHFFAAQGKRESLEAALKDTHEAVRVAALGALGKLSQHGDVPIEHFVSALNDPHWEVRATAVQVLGTLGKAAQLQPTLAALKDPDEQVRIAAIYVAGTWGQQVPVADLIAGLHDPEWQVREAAAVTLGALGEQVHVEPLVEALLPEKNTFVREALLSALGERIPIDRLVGDLRFGKEISLRVEAAQALGELGARAPLEPLLEALKRESQGAVRQVVILALGRLGRPTALPALEEALEDNDQGVREAAELVLFGSPFPLSSTGKSQQQPEAHTEAPLQSTEVLPTRDTAQADRTNVVSPTGQRAQEHLLNSSGQRIGPYVLVRLLSQRDGASVYLGKHVSFENEAALKVLPLHLSPQDVEVFRTEARTIAQLRHPSIVRVFDFGVEQGRVFVAMDYAPDGTLRDRHPQGEQVPLPTVISYVKQVAEALHHAHERKVVHRNVKPQNLLLDAHGSVLLSDFGLAVVERSAENQHQRRVASKLPYMAPEQLLGQPHPASDQYALAIVAYEWLSGSLPFAGPPIKTVAQHLQASPPSLCAKVAGLPLNIEKVVFTALSKVPQERFASVRAFATALEQASR